MTILQVHEKMLERDAGLWKKFGRYGVLFFFLKGLLWVLGPWIIYTVK